MMADDRDERIAQLEAEVVAAQQREGVATDRAVRAEAERDEALAQQTATADILRLIATSPTTSQPVLEAVAQRTRQFSDSHIVVVNIHEGDSLRVAALAGVDPERPV